MHFSHMHPDTVNFAITNGIDIFVLPPHTSHFLQPLDVGVYGRFKGLYEKELLKFPLNNGGVEKVEEGNIL